VSTGHQEHKSTLWLLATGATWLTAAQAVIQGATFATSLILARVLGTSGFGEYSFLQSSLNNFSLIAQLSFGLMATKFLAADAHQRPKRSGQLLGLGSLMTVANGSLLALALLAFAGMLSAPGSVFAISVPLVAIACAIPFAALSLFQIGVLQGLRQFRHLAMLSLFQSGAAVALPWTGALIAGVPGASLGLALYVAARCFTNEAVIRRSAHKLGIERSYRPAPGLTGAVLRFAVPASLSGFTTASGQWLASLVLLHQADGPYQMGAYAIAMNVRVLALFVPNQLGAAALTMMSRHLADGSARSYVRVLGLNVIVTLSCAVAAALVLAIATPTLLGLFGADSAHTRVVVYTMLAAAVAEAFSIAVYQRLPSESRMWTSFFFVALPRDSCFIGLSLALVGTYRALGLAAALGISQLVAIGGVFLGSGRARKGR
jgi:O-antigen/teichoic acid export membrane protein